ncbi:uncharacterized protein NESG_01098 [Nematocida ausubeli]|uniref:Uncharacterized protein n=1 Tax=Nematocida ausubeli (strain ATCC PRA-371 / ERTm2) TaxID=1913371 RepID=A0A086J1G9_NEMA1|nr:uncharacterized protein NESG_01098 [Nematocida ausubeli]KAI5147036.1 hypothetical protein NEAUS05_0367 [Nematocida ausubeli]KFG25987.1 hypothetical protein NESG_01098 [Nematocida ausubeli]
MLLVLLTAALLLYIAHTAIKHQEEVEKVKGLQKEIRNLKKEMQDLRAQVQKYKGYERNFYNLKKSYFDLLDKAVKPRKKSE